MWATYYTRYAYVMFPYGMYRQWTSDIKPPYDLYGHRCAASILGGCWYAMPYGIFKIFNLMNRINIHYEGRDPSSYPNAYEELLGTNHRVL